MWNPTVDGNERSDATREQLRLLSSRTIPNQTEMKMKLMLLTIAAVFTVFVIIMGANTPTSGPVNSVKNAARDACVSEQSTIMLNLTRWRHADEIYDTATTYCNRIYDPR